MYEVFLSDPNTVERQRLITGTSFDDFKVKFDGIGRPYQNQQLTPDCAGYIKVDTSYDVVGHTNTASNPYCLTSEITYGITQNQYDALGRSIKTTKQDQASPVLFTTMFPAIRLAHRQSAPPPRMSQERNVNPVPMLLDVCSK